MDIDDAICDALKDYPEWLARFRELQEAEADRDELKEQVASLEQEEADETAHLTDALEAVKYWMHDVMVLGKPMSDPRKVLRIVERAVS